MPNPVQETILSRRSIRRFQRKPIPGNVVSDILEAARMAPTGSNMQPLRFLCVRSEQLCAQVFPFTHWAGATF